MKKKVIAAVAAASIGMAVICTAANAAKQYSVSELRGLNEALIGGASLTEGQDLNNDGKVNVFDLVEMRKSFVNTGDFIETTVPATEENVRYIGRNCVKDNVPWLVQSGAAVEFVVNDAKSAEITILGDENINSEDRYKPRYAVIVDDEIVVDELMSVKSKTVELFSGTEPRTARIKVIHLSEANNGTVGVSGIKVNSDCTVPVSPTEKKDMTIEFIGDSITCGYGVEGKSNGEQFSTGTENFMKSYAYLTAEKLGADYSAVSYSGYGVVSGYTTGEKNTDSLVPKNYAIVGQQFGYDTPWDFESHKSNVIVINLGTNDSSYTSTDVETRGPEYQEKYVEFLKQIRTLNPDSYIICTFGTMGGETLYPYLEKAVDEFVSDTGDTKITCYQCATQSASDGYGCDWHPSAVTQQKSAAVLADKICQVTGKYSDQIGLNVAANVEFSLSTDPDSKVSIYPYFNEYDRSFWMNVMTTGASAEDAEGIASGVDLRKGGKYRVTFDCAAASGMTFPVIIRSSDKSAVYFSSTIECTGNTTSFSEEFTCDETDRNADFVLQVGTASGNVAIQKLNIEKIG